MKIIKYIFFAFSEELNTNELMILWSITTKMKHIQHDEHGIVCAATSFHLRNAYNSLEC